MVEISGIYGSISSSCSFPNRDAAQFLKEADAGVCIEPENADQLAEAVQGLADNPRLCRSLGRAGYEYTRKHHDFNTLANDYLDMLDHVREQQVQNKTITAPAAKRRMNF